MFNRGVKFSALVDVQTGTAEEYWPDIEGLEHREAVTDFGLPEGTFFDCALVHLLTTATLDRLRELYPQGRFEVRRSSKYCCGGRGRRERFRGERMDRAHARNRRCRSSECHWSVPPLRDDYAAAVISRKMQVFCAQQLSIAELTWGSTLP